MMFAAEKVGIRVEGAARRFPNGNQALDRLDLEIRAGELLTVLGPSGSGKSTLLNVLAGLETVDQGKIWFGARDVTATPPESRRVSVVFQSAVMYPHMTLRESIGFAPRLAKTPPVEIRQRVAEAAAWLHIEDLLDRRPHEVSGGERQRAAIAKAMVTRPALLLMDEPFSALDAQLRRELRTQFVRLHREFGATTIFVTHDQEEAMGMGDRVAVMRDGRLVQLAPPLDLYRNPVDTWVANFISLQPLNLIPARRVGTEVSLFGGAVTLPSPPMETPAEFLLGVRAESLRLEPVDRDGLRVLTAEAVGEQSKYAIAAPDGTTLVALMGADRALAPDSSVRLSIDWPRAMIFDLEQGRRCEIARDVQAAT
jgi:multiple sugar transport system ATP-binding protein